MKYMKWWLPVLLFALITPFTPMLDLGIARYFYQGNGQFVSNDLTSFFYEYGVIPADVALVIAVIVYLVSFFVARLKKWRSTALVYILTMALGAGVIVHGIFKDHWGRPRPKQVIEFGGDQEFRPYWKPNFNPPEPSKAFTCGHCTTGFCFLALAISGRRMNSKALMYTGIVLGMGLGIALCITRMAQGGHFLSDTLASGLVIWLTAVTADWLLHPD